MRVACLSLIALIPMFIYCHPAMRARTPERGEAEKEKRYDTLQKYSYLVIGLSRKFNGELDLDSIDVSSGFFFRKGGKLYLVSAHHVLTNYNLYAISLYDQPKDHLQVWYRNKRGEYKYEKFPPKSIKGLRLKHAGSMPPYSIRNTADVAAIDVTGHFRDGEIYSVEGMVPGNWKEDPVLPGDSIVGFGYHNLKPGWKKDTVPSPAFVGCGVIEMPDKLFGNSDTLAAELKKELAIRYIAIEPRLSKGISGAPLFRIWSGKMRKRTVELAGVQSGSTKEVNYSLMVKLEEVMKLFN